MKASNQPFHGYSSIFIHFTASKNNTSPPPHHLPCYTRQTNWVVVFRTCAIRHTQKLESKAEILPPAKKAAKTQTSITRPQGLAGFCCSFFISEQRQKTHPARSSRRKARSPKTPRIKALKPPDKNNRARNSKAWRPSVSPIQV